MVKTTRVRAKDIGQTYSGYYNYVRRKPGDVFDIFAEGHFSEKWMEKVAADTSKTDAPGEPSLESLKADGIIKDEADRPMALSEIGKARADSAETQRAKEALQGTAEATGKGRRR